MGPEQNLEDGNPIQSDRAYIADLLEELCRAPRSAGSTRGAAVAADLAARYRDMGYDVELDASEFTGWELIERPRVRLLSPESRELFDCLPVVWSGSTPGSVTGRIVPGAAGFPRCLTTFEAYPWSCLPVVDDAAGVPAGVPAACLLSGPRIWPQPRDDASDPVPYVMIAPTDGDFIQRCLSRNVQVRVSVSVGSRYLPGQKMTNLIARDREPGPPGPATVVAAHYDSFFSTVGAHDNASGTAALLCLARRLTQAGRSSERSSTRPHSSVRLISFDAEEWNKLGSYRYVESLERAGRLSEVRAMINIDSVGVGAGIYLSVAPPHAPSLRAALRALSSGGEPDSQVTRVAGVLRRRQVIISPEAQAASFDSWPFARHGIPAVQVGTFGPQPFPHWHQPGDNLSVIGAGGHELISDVATLVEGLLRAWDV